MKFWLQSYTKYSKYPTLCAKIIINQSIFLTATDKKRTKKTTFFVFFRFLLQYYCDFFCNFAARNRRLGAVN